MKKVICILMVFALLLPMATPVFAAESAVTDAASYVEVGTSDTIRLETVDVSSSAASRKSLSSDVYSTRIFRNNILEEQLYVDIKNNLLRHEYPDGSVITEALSDVVTISKVASSTDAHPLKSHLSSSTEGATRTDYILNEPFTILHFGAQADLSGQPTYLGYQAMGYRGGYFYAPTTYGYLQRRNAGFVNVYFSHLFEFSAGTTIGTAASIVVAFATNNGIALAISVAVSLLSAIIEVVTYDWSASFEIRRYKWEYRIRLNSNVGTILDTNYRTREYWKGYSESTGEATYQYRGSAYDGGFLLSNTEMINLVLDEYIASQSQ